MSTELEKLQQYEHSLSGATKKPEKGNSPVGAVLGIGAGGFLCYGLYSFINSKGALASNKAMRGRVLAQGAAVGALFAYAGWTYLTSDQKALKAEQDRLASLNSPPASYKHVHEAAPPRQPRHERA